MPVSLNKNRYDHLDRAGLVALVMERDVTIEKQEATVKSQQEALIKAQEQIAHISRILNLRNKKIFCSSSEKRDRIGEDLAFEDVKGKDPCTGDSKGTGPTDVRDGEPAADGQTGAAVSGRSRKRKSIKAHPGRNPIPAAIRRVVENHYPEGYEPTWKRELPPEITERLTLKIDFYVKVDVRHKFARGGEIVVAPWPLDDPFYKYKATAELVCTMMFLRFGLHMPYYRVRQLLPGCRLPYSTQIGWAGRFFDIIDRLGPVLAQEIVKNTRLLSMDETPFKLLDTPSRIERFKADHNARGERYLRDVKGVDKEALMESTENDADMEAEITAGLAKGKAILRGQMWTLLNTTTGLVMFQYSPSRATINAMLMLCGYKGMLMADAYAAYRKLARLSQDAIILLSCWAHARRKMLECREAKFRDPVVKEIIWRIGELYKIERGVKGLSPGKRKKARKRSKKLLRSLKEYLEIAINDYTPRDAVRMAIQYILNHWDALTQYVHHKQGTIDNNPTERIIRAITVARKNILFLGSIDHAPGAALLYSLLECCKLQKINPQAWLPDVVKRLEYCSPDQLIDLLPHRWKLTHPEAQITS